MIHNSKSYNSNTLMCCEFLTKLKSESGGKLTYFHRIVEVKRLHTLKMASNQFFVVQIRSGDRILKDWFGASVDNGLPLVELFSQFASGM